MDFMNKSNIFIILIIFILYCQSSQNIQKKTTEPKKQNNVTNIAKEEYTKFIEEQKRKKEQSKQNIETTENNKKQEDIKEETTNLEQTENANTNIQEKQKKDQDKKNDIAMTDTDTQDTLDTTKPEPIKPPEPTEEDKQMILFFKKEHLKEEELYKKDYEAFLEIKRYILSFKDSVHNEENQYKEFKISYLQDLENKKQLQLEYLNRIDPERKAFWRWEQDQNFNETIIIPVKENRLFVCEIQDPYLYLYNANFDCKNKIYTIRKEILENRNYFEEISLFEILPDRKGFYIIFEQDKTQNKKNPLKFYDKNNQENILSYIESDGENLIKLYLYSIQQKENQKRIYFKIVSPLNILFRFSE
ncbi:MAG: hypothetical protein KatS3mg129_1457 [Leptospiraceae bacterium]|nr:MAG: hypothetical protein KatS3mg129_1457 [Leptospiraceae bacterium]